MELRHYIDAFSSLHTAKVKGRKAPHKAVLLLAIIDLIEEEVILGQAPCKVRSRLCLTEILSRKMMGCFSYATSFWS